MRKPNFDVTLNKDILRVENILTMDIPDDNKLTRAQRARSKYSNWSMFGVEHFIDMRNIFIHIDGLICKHFEFKQYDWSGTNSLTIEEKTEFCRELKETINSSIDKIGYSEDCVLLNPAKLLTATDYNDANLVIARMGYNLVKKLRYTEKVTTKQLLNDIF